MRLILIFCIPLFFSCSTSKNVSPACKINFKEIGHGVSESNVIVRDPMSKSPTGLRSYSDDYKIIVSTDTIPGKKGSRFGVVYELQSSDDTVVTLKVEWIYPKKIVNNDGQSFRALKYKTTRSTNQETYSSYILDEDYEVVPGKWIFRLSYNKKKIYEHVFYVK